MQAKTTPAFGCVLASWTDGLRVHPDIILQGESAGTYDTIAVDQYEVHPTRGAVVRKPYDASGNAVDWSGYAAFRASYALYDVSTNSATYVTNQAQTVDYQDFGIAPFDPVTGQLNESTQAANKYLAGDYLSLGDVGTRPYDSTHGTGIWADKTGLYGLLSGVRQAYLSATDGKIYAGAGSVVLDTNGVSVILDTTASSTRSYRLVKPDGTVTGRVSGYSDASIHSLELGALTLAGEDAVTVVYSHAPTGKVSSSAIQAQKSSVATVEVGVIDDGSNDNYAYVVGGNLHIGAKSMPVVPLHVGTGTITGAAPTGSLVGAYQDETVSGDYLVGAFVGNWAGTDGSSMQGLEGYVTTNHASGTLGLALGVIAHTQHLGAGAVTSSKVFTGSLIINNGSGNVTNAYIYKSDGMVRVGGAPGTITNGYGLYLDALPTSGVTNRYGVYVAGSGDQNYFAGNVGIGDSTPGESLDISSATANQGVRVTYTGTSGSNDGPQISMFTNDGAAMASSERIGQFIFGGYDGTAAGGGAAILVKTTEAWSSSAHGAEILFYTVPNTTTTQTLRLTIENSGNLKFADGVDVELNTSTGSMIGTATNQKLGFWGATPVTRPTGYTQTYSTAVKTMGALTATTMTGSTGTADGVLQDVTAAHDQTILNNNFKDVFVMLNALLVDIIDVKRNLNAVIDDLQAVGFTS